MAKLARKRDEMEEIVEIVLKLGFGSMIVLGLYSAFYLIVRNTDLCFKKKLLGSKEKTEINVFFCERFKARWFGKTAFLWRRFSKILSIVAWITVLLFFQHYFLTLVEDPGLLFLAGLSIFTVIAKSFCSIRYKEIDYERWSNSPCAVIGMQAIRRERQESWNEYGKRQHKVRNYELSTEIILGVIALMLMLYL